MKYEKNYGLRYRAENLSEAYTGGSFPKEQRSGRNIRGACSAAENDNEALELLYNASKEAGASMSVLRSDNIRATLEDFVLQNSITHIIMGSAGPGAYNKFYEHLRRRFPEVYIFADCEDGRAVV